MNDERSEIAEFERGDGAPRDGIGEEDNPIPLWFNVSFYGAIVFGIFYIFYYDFSGWSQVSQYQAQVERVEAKVAATRPSLPSENPYRGDPQAIQEGATVFATICAACHKPDATGLVGPSLVDPYWKYGHSDAELFETVSKGRPGGMPAWGPQLGNEKIWKVLAYIETLPHFDEPGVGAPDHQGGG